ncbi:MAG: MAPEG family protein [Nevskiaceae bacterium]|nr:MAG: MAPEG family protein [Nevskiaceae bacterium]TBR71994.1 MAG: MAPEG family protein [Nevskiaceae bacterium]
MTPMTALLAFAAWTLLLVALVLAYRSVRILSGTPADAWTRGKPSIDPGFVVRLTHAHLNCLENLPIFAVIVLVAGAQDKLPVIGALAAWVFYARVVQSCVHLVGVNPLLVTVRGTFWIIQIVLFAVMFARLFG